MTTTSDSIEPESSTIDSTVGVAATEASDIAAEVRPAAHRAKASKPAKGPKPPKVAKTPRVAKPSKPATPSKPAKASKPAISKAASTIVARLARTSRTAVTAPAKAAASWNSNMLEAAESGPRNGTRWGRGGAIVVPSVVVTAALGSAIANGVLAASLNLTNQPFTLKSNKLAGTGMGLYLNSANTSGGSTPSARVGIATASLDGFCGIVKQTMTIGGIGKDVYLIMTAGQTVTGDPNTTPTRVINASNLFLQATALSGSTVNDAAHQASIQNAILGISADNVQMPTGAGGAAQTMPQSSNYGSSATAGSFGLQGSGLDSSGNVTPGTITIPGLSAAANDTEIAGTLNLPNLAINISAQNTGTTPPSCPSTGF